MLYVENWFWIFASKDEAGFLLGLTTLSFFSSCSDRSTSLWLWNLNVLLRCGFIWPVPSFFLASIERQRKQHPRVCTSGKYTLIYNDYYPTVSSKGILFVCISYLFVFWSKIKTNILHIHSVLLNLVSLVLCRSTIPTPKQAPLPLGSQGCEINNLLIQ